MVAKSNSAAATQHAAQRLERIIDSHRSYFSEWRSDKFDRLNAPARTEKPSSAPNKFEQNKIEK